MGDEFNVCVDVARSVRRSSNSSSNVLLEFVSDVNISFVVLVAIFTAVEEWLIVVVNNSEGEWNFIDGLAFVSWGSTSFSRSAYATRSTNANFISGSNAVVVGSTRNTSVLFLKNWSLSGNFLLEFNTNTSRFCGIGGVVIESFLAVAEITVVGILANCISVALVSGFVGTFVEATDTSWAFTRSFILVRTLTLASISTRKIHAFSVSVAIVEVWRFTFVNDIITNSSWMRWIFIMVSRSALACVSILLVSTIGESTAVVEGRISAFINLQETFTTGSLRVRRFINRVDWTTTSVSISLILTDSKGIAIVQATVETFVYFSNTDSARTTSKIGALIDITITATTGVSVLIISFTADGSRIAIVSVGIETNRFGKNTYTTWLVLNIR